MESGLLVAPAHSSKSGPRTCLLLTDLAVSTERDDNTQSCSRILSSGLRKGIYPRGGLEEDSRATTLLAGRLGKCHARLNQDPREDSGSLGDYL